MVKGKTQSTPPGLLLLSEVTQTVQQSIEDEPAAQLLVPHIRSPAHWESESQSPSPRLQGAEEVQQDWSSFEGLQGDNVDDPPPPAETIVGK